MEFFICSFIGAFIGCIVGYIIGFYRGSKKGYQEAKRRYKFTIQDLDAEVRRLKKEKP